MDFRQAFDPLRALGVVLRLFRRAPLTLLLGGLFLFLTHPPTPFAVDRWVGLPWSSLPVCVIALFLLPLHALFAVGYPAALQRVMVTGEERFKDLFQDRGLWLSMFLAMLLRLGLTLLLALPFTILFAAPVGISRMAGSSWIGWTLGAIFGLAYLPIFLYVALGFVLIEEAVAIENKRPVEAVQRSWEIAEGNRMQLLIYTSALVLLQFTWVLVWGILALMTCFCLGPVAWVLAPLPSICARAAWFESYLRFAYPAPEPSDEGGMWVNTAP